VRGANHHFRWDTGVIGARARLVAGESVVRPRRHLLLAIVAAGALIGCSGTPPEAPPTAQPAGRIVGRTLRDAPSARLTFVQADLSSMSEAVRVGRELPTESFYVALFTTGIIAAKAREETPNTSSGTWRSAT
jgi:hypothetical protein